MGPGATIGERAKAEIRSVLADAGAIRNQINGRRNLIRSIWWLNVRHVSDGSRTLDEQVDGLFPTTPGTFGGLPTSGLPSSTPPIDLTLAASRLHHTSSEEGRGVTTEWINFKRRAFRS
jgi:hypothetical protein